jgi:hypothetical protein
MTVHRLGLYRAEDPYTRVPNVSVNDDTLDLKARGLLLFMLSKPDGWAFRERALASQCGVSREQIRTALQRLVDSGYVRRVRKMVDGQPRVETQVFDVSQREGPGSLPATVRVDDGGETVPVSNERERARTNASQTPTSEVRAVTSKAARDALFDTMCAVCNHDPARLTSSERGRINKALKLLREVNATPDEIRGAATAWAIKYPRATLTPTAIAAHWSTLQRRTVRTFEEADPDLEAIRDAERTQW